MVFCLWNLIAIFIVIELTCVQTGSNSIIPNNAIRASRSFQEHSRPQSKYISASVWDDGYQNEPTPESLEGVPTLKHLTWHPSFDLEDVREKFLSQISSHGDSGPNDHNPIYYTKKDAKPILNKQEYRGNGASDEPPQTLYYQDSKMICLGRDLIDSARLYYLAMKRHQWPPDLQAAFEKTRRQNRSMPVFESCIPLIWTRKAMEPKRDSFSPQKALPPKSTIERGKRSARCMQMCVQGGHLHPAQCHSLC